MLPMFPLPMSPMVTGPVVSAAPGRREEDCSGSGMADSGMTQDWQVEIRQVANGGRSWMCQCGSRSSRGSSLRIW